MTWLVAESLSDSWSNPVFQPKFFTEFCSWKQDRLVKALEHMGKSGFKMISETSVLSAPSVDLLRAELCIVAIKCDDISQLSSTPRGGSAWKGPRRSILLPVNEMARPMFIRSTPNLCAVGVRGSLGIYKKRCARAQRLWLRICRSQPTNHEERH